MLDSVDMIKMIATQREDKDLVPLKKMHSTARQSENSADYAGKYTAWLSSQRETDDQQGITSQEPYRRNGG